MGDNEIATSSAKGGLLAMTDFGTFCSEMEFFNKPISDNPKDYSLNNFDIIKRSLGG